MKQFDDESRNSGPGREITSEEPQLQSFYTKKVRIRESGRSSSVRDRQRESGSSIPDLSHRTIRKSPSHQNDDDILEPSESTQGRRIIRREQTEPLKERSERLSSERGTRPRRESSERTTTESGKSFLIHGSILAVASIVVRIIGLLYRIPMIRIIGTEGSAYYSSAYKIYSIMLLISSYSMPLAVSKLVSARLSRKQYKDGFKVISGAFLFSLIVGGICSVTVFVFADYFATYILNMPLAAIPLRVLAPAIFIMAFLGVFRGFFQGLNTMIPTAVSQIFEQIVNAAVSVGMSWWLFELGHKADLVKGTLENGASLGAAGGTLGTTMGALTALIFCAFMYLRVRPGYRRQIRRDRDSENESMPTVLKMLILTIFPVLLSTTAYNLIDIVDQSVFSYYMSGRKLLAEYKLIWGAYDNMYILMLHVPVAISSALASSSVPAITASMARGDTKDVVSKVKGAIRFTMMISFPCAVGLGVLAEPIMNSLFAGNDYHEKASIYLALGCIAVIFFALSTVTNGILQGIGKMALPVRHALIALAVHLVIMVPMLWVYNMHIYGVILSYIAFGMVMSFLNLVSIENELDMDIELKKAFVMPGVASLLMGLCVLGASYVTRLVLHSDKWCLLAGMLVGIVVYAILLFGLGMIREEDLKDMPKGRAIAGAAEKLHLLR